ncbi:hypothetical protein V7124_19500 [Neobacillus niacini]|uniref:hypothetical protein n=1 Tax=Neobacillus niacini TaxID=86668 RepID=UPI002FFDE711
MERMLRVGRTVIEVFVGRNLHLYDRDQEGTMTLTNAIDANYLENVIGWIGEVPFDRVFLYHTDGYITQWSAEKGFQHVKSSNPELYYRFVERCEERKKQYQFVH